ncbi:MAG TPA: long-chain fatty acid--CoA ligase [Armatimonadota bacterium]|jgi:long-chain acyl-CoA synthetase
MTIFDLLAEAVAQDPAAPSVIYREKTYTYGELLAMVDGFAGGLAALGLKRGSRIALLLPNCPPFIIAYLAASRIGCTVVPMNVLYRPDEARFILADAGAEALVTAEPFRPLVQALRPHLPELKHVVMAGDGELADGEVAFRQVCAHKPPRHVSVSERDVAVILYTSGTTGRPKGAMLSHKNLLANAQSCADLLHVNSSDCFFSALPLFHAFAAMVYLILPIKVGARIPLLERFMPSQTLQMMEDTGATVFGGVPSMFGLLLQVPRETRPDLSKLRLCVSGGAPLPPEIMTAFIAMFDVVMVEGYGLTEASPVVAANPPDGVKKIGSIGPPLPGIQVKIIDDQGRAVGQGVIGELLVKGENVMKGYLHKPQETKQVVKNGWLYTGDLARADEDGYLYIVGRKKEMIIVGGLNVYPGEVERVLVEHPAVLEAAAFGIPDPARGEAVWAAVILRPELQATAKELQALCREKLASYKVPRGIDIRSELPKNALGKVVRHLLHEEVVQRMQTAAKAPVEV